MIKVTLTGSECTGKTTLAEALAAHYRTIWVPEFARQFVLEKGAPPGADDVDAIARGQIELEELAAEQAHRRGAQVLVLDTDLLSTVVYSRHYYGDCPHWIERELGQRAAGLYLLADIDVPWAPDGDQRDRGENRDAMQDLFRAALSERQLPFEEVSGGHEERLRDAIAAVDAREER